MSALVVDNFAKTLVAVKDLKSSGVILDYALGGAMALIFWSEPTTTFDLDVFVTLPSSGPLLSLGSIYEWARARGYHEVKEHIVIEGLPVQFLPAHNSLAEEAIATAADLDYESEAVRVIRPEYLIAMYLESSARTKARVARVAALLDEGNLDRALLGRIVAQHGLTLP